VRSLGLVALVAGCGFQSTLAPNGTADANGRGSDASAIDPGPDTGPAIDAGVDAAPPPDAATCFGNIVRICLSSVPTAPLTLPGASSSFDTTRNANCHGIARQTDGPELCVLVGTTITVNGPLVATGARPLVLLASDSITVTSSIDVSSKRPPSTPGAGANTGTCVTAGPGQADDGGGGGGGGGGFGTTGGRGGIGDQNDTSAAGVAVGGTPGGRLTSFPPLRGGCPGNKGGDRDGGHRGGGGGSGGGSITLIAGDKITIAGDVFASGAGGSATTGGSGAERGGGGGGAGGMIVLDALTIELSGRIAANGGAGGGGGGRNNGGTSGGDGTTTAWDQRAAPGTAGDSGGNAGAPGAAGTTRAGTTSLDGGASDRGGGGAAGGLGVILTHGTVSGDTVSPAPIAR
jgi:hypothetical protein